MSNTAVTNSLNDLLADFHVMIVKLHNFHWNVSGLEFISAHEKTEEYYTWFFGQFDELAERVLQIGDKPVSTVRGYLERATIAEDERSEFSARDVFGSVLDDFVGLLGKVRAGEAAAADAEDNGTADLLNGMVGWFEKEIWMLGATMKSS